MPTDDEVERLPRQWKLAIMEWERRTYFLLKIPEIIYLYII